MKQAEKVLAYMQRFGSITNYEACIELDILDLRKIISDLKKSGYNIRSVWEERTNRMGETKRYKRHCLES